MAASRASGGPTCRREKEAAARLGAMGGDLLWSSVLLDGERVPSDGAASYAWCTTLHGLHIPQPGARASQAASASNVICRACPLGRRRRCCLDGRPRATCLREKHGRASEREAGQKERTLENGGERAAGSKPNCVHRRRGPMRNLSLSALGSIFS